MKNLKQETIEALREIGKTFDDVLYICGDNYQITKENYLSIAAKTNYVDGFGGMEVAPDLRIIGEDFILIREEYDGSEFFKAVNLRPPKETRQINYLTNRDVYQSEDRDYKDKMFDVRMKNVERNNYDWYSSETIQELNWYNESCEQ